MSYEIMKSHIKSGNFASCYHFFGEENYLKFFYLDKMRDSIVPEMREFNLLEFEESITPSELDIAVGTPPILGGKKLVILKDTGIFKLGGQKEKEWTDFFNRIPENTHIIAAEDSFDKRNGVYKAFSQKAVMVEFQKRSQNDIKLWLLNIAKKNGKELAASDALYITDMLGNDMNTVKGEFDKLLAYAEKHDIITREDIDTVISREYFTREYELTDAVISQNREKSFSLLYELKIMQTDPIYILNILSSAFLSCRRAKWLLLSGMSVGETAAKLKLPLKFLENKYIGYARYGKDEFFSRAVSLCREYDFRIKSGMISPEIGIDTLCAEITSETVG